MESTALPALRGVTIAVINVEAMVAFYNALFGAELEPFEGFGAILYGGRLSGLPFLLCPNEILGIEADKNRIQLSFTVPNLDEMLGDLEAYGGAQIQPISEQPGRRLCGIVDPDGNTIELEELTAV